MLDLQPGVHLQKIEFAALDVVDEFHRAGRTIAHRGTELFRRRVQRASLLDGKVRCRRFLQHFLVAALHRAIAVAHRHHARAVAEYLYLDMARPRDQTFQIDAVVLEVLRRQPFHPGENLGQVGRLVHRLHADAAAARHCLDHDRETDAICCRDRILDAVQQAAARRQGHAGTLGHVARAVLEAEGLDLLRRGAEESDAVRLACARERHVFRQETVTGMHGLRTGGPARRQDRIGIQIALRGGGRPHAYGLVGMAHVRGAAIRFGIHGHALHAHFLQRADHPPGDLAAVGHQNLVEHRHLSCPPSCQIATICRTPSVGRVSPVPDRMISPRCITA